MPFRKTSARNRASRIALLFLLAIIRPWLPSAKAGTLRDGGLGLCVGISGYAHLSPLSAPANDAKTVANALLATGGFRRVLILNDNPDTLASRDKILDTLRLLANNADRTDSLVFYFSGHGLSHEGKTYLMPLDAEPTGINDPDAGIPMDEILAIMRKSRAAGKLLMVDANSGVEMFPGISGVIDVEAGSFAAIVSCGEGQYSIVDESRGLSLFAMALETALSGRADADGDDALTGKELWEFLDHYMSDYCFENVAGSGQNPQMSADDYGSAMIYGPAFGSIRETVREEVAEAQPPEVPGGVDDAEIVSEAEPPASAASDESETGMTAVIDDAELRRRLDAASALLAAGKREDAFAAFMDLTGYGMAEAEFQVGDYYYFDNGEGTDRKKAEEWFIRAGDLGHAEAQARLGVMYWFGIGVPQDQSKASKWSTLKGKIPDDAKPIINKRPGGAATTVKTDGEAHKGETPERTADGTPVAAVPPVVQQTVRQQPYQGQYYPQYQQQRSQGQYQRQNDPNSFGMQMRRYFLGF